MKIKVQIIGHNSTNSLINSGAQHVGSEENPFTFVAFSDAMKVRALELFMKSPLKIGLSIFNGEAKTGEWHEPLIPTAMFNSPVKMMEQVDTNTLVDELIGRLKNDSHVDDNKKIDLATLLIGSYT
jgi:hypothetical protein